VSCIKLTQSKYYSIYYYYYYFKVLLGCYVFINVCCRLPIAPCSHIQYHNPFSKLLRKIFGRLPGQIGYYLSYCVDWHSLDRERISILGEILLQTTVMIDFRCLSVRRDRLFVLLLVITEKNCSHA
jgi:hypothetical protein